MIPVCLAAIGLLISFCICVARCLKESPENDTDGTSHEYLCSQPPEYNEALQSRPTVQTVTHPGLTQVVTTPPPGYDTAVSGLFMLTLPSGCPTPPFDRAFQSQRQNQNSTRISSASSLLEGYDNRGFVTEEGNVPRTPPPKYETLISFSWQGLFWNNFNGCVKILQSWLIPRFVTMPTFSSLVTSGVIVPTSCLYLRHRKISSIQPPSQPMTIMLTLWQLSEYCFRRLQMI